jgi:hypothetical protein
MTELSPPAPGYWLASDGNWYPPAAPPPPAAPEKKEERPVIAITFAILFLLSIAYFGFRGAHHDNTSAPATPTTVAAPATREALQSDAETATTLDTMWSQMGPDQQADFCSALSQIGRVATANGLETGSGNTLNGDAVMAWVETREDQCKTISGSGG